MDTEKKRTIKIEIIKGTQEDFKQLYDNHLTSKSIREKLLANPEMCQRLVMKLIDCIPLSKIDSNPFKNFEILEHEGRLEKVMKFIDDEKLPIDPDSKQALYNAFDWSIRLLFSAEIDIQDYVSFIQPHIKACFEESDISDYKVNGVIGFACYQYELLNFSFEPKTMEHYSDKVYEKLRQIKRKSELKNING
jgi:hypothetical protein